MPFPATNIRDDEDAGGTAVAMPAQPCVNELNGYCTSIPPPPHGDDVHGAGLAGGRAPARPALRVLIVDSTGIKPAAGTGLADDCW